MIGIDYLKNEELRLYGCLNDIIALGNILMDAFDYKKNDITMIRDDSRNNLLIPNKKNILRELNNIVDNNENDEIWIHFSGHGTYTPDINNDENDNMDEIILPIDFRINGVIKDEEMFNIIKKSKCKTFITYDCCNSASIMDLPWRFEFINGHFYKYKENNNVIANKNICMITSCRDNQLAVDGWSDDNRNSFGALTQAIMECLRFNHYNVTIFKLVKDISEYLRLNEKLQITNLSSSSENPIFEIRRPLLNKSNNNTYTLWLDKNFRD